ncbi:MAG TPA: hypothetical protein VFQ53_02175 [Kofleriaceae bacterium]|nr:hypothetical protein [Kofleriaceae bacterium]
MRPIRTAALTAALLVAASAAPAAADHHDDLTFEIKEYANATRSYVADKLMTLKLPDKCWDKVLDKKNRGLALVASAAFAIEKYAGQVTGDDWSHIEGQSANTRDQNRAIVEKMVADFSSRFHLTLELEGDDCDATGNAMWLKYLGTVAHAFEQYPPKSGKAFVTIKVVAKAKAVKTEVSKDGTKFTVTGPRDIEVPGWPNEVEKPVLRVSTKN